MARSHSVLTWFGGKAYLASRIVSLIPDRGLYVEVFGGGGSVLFALPPRAARREVYNDRDDALVHFFRVLRDPIAGPELIRRLRYWPYSRRAWYEARATWATCTDPIERAVRWYAVARQSFSGIFGRSWHFSVQQSAWAPSGWVHAVDSLPLFAERLREVQIDGEDWSRILERYDGSHTTFYCDPPYVPATRRDGQYRIEMTEDDHRELVARLLTIRGQAIVSGYDHPVYQPLTAAWGEPMRIPVTSFAIARSRYTRLQGSGAVLRAPHTHRMECLWVSPGLRRSIQLQWDEVEGFANTPGLSDAGR